MTHQQNRIANLLSAEVNEDFSALPRCEHDRRCLYRRGQQSGIIRDDRERAPVFKAEAKDAGIRSVQQTQAIQAAVNGQPRLGRVVDEDCVSQKTRHRVHFFWGERVTAPAVGALVLDQQGHVVIARWKF